MLLIWLSFEYIRRYTNSSIADYARIVNSVKFAVDENLLALGSDDFSMRIWHLDKDRRKIVLIPIQQRFNDLLIQKTG